MIIVRHAIAPVLIALCSRSLLHVCYSVGMPTTHEKLESLFAKVRSLSEPRQQAAVEALSEIAEEPYKLSEEELAVLEPALERAERGEFVSEVDAAEVLDKPWR